MDCGCVRIVNGVSSTPHLSTGPADVTFSGVTHVVAESGLDQRTEALRTLTGSALKSGLNSKLSADASRRHDVRPRCSVLRRMSRAVRRSTAISQPFRRFSSALGRGSLRSIEPARPSPQRSGLHVGICRCRPVGACADSEVVRVLVPPQRLAEQLATGSKSTRKRSCRRL